MPDPRITVALTDGILSWRASQRRESEMADTLEEIRDRNSTLFNKTESGEYQETDRRDLYRDIHWLAKRLRDLELRSTDTIEVHEDGTVSPAGASILREPK